MNRSRGVDPWPGAATDIKGERIKLFGFALVDGQQGAPGELLGLQNESLVVACGEGAISIAELQAPGKKRCPAKAFLAGRPLPNGTILG